VVFEAAGPERFPDHPVRSLCAAGGAARFDRVYRSADALWGPAAFSEKKTTAEDE